VFILLHLIRVWRTTVEVTTFHKVPACRANSRQHTVFAVIRYCYAFRRIRLNVTTPRDHFKQASLRAVSAATGCRKHKYGFARSPTTALAKRLTPTVPVEKIPHTLRRLIEIDGRNEEYSVTILDLPLYFRKLILYYALTFSKTIAPTALADQTRFNFYRGKIDVLGATSDLANTLQHLLNASRRQSVIIRTRRNYQNHHALPPFINYTASSAAAWTVDKKNDLCVRLH
jgi:hypothetical protein